EDEDGAKRTETYTERGAPVVLMPEDLTVSANATSQIRSRGIFDVPVYSVDLDMAFGFDLDRIAGVMGGRETVLWDKAVLSIAMPRTRSFTGAAVLKTGGRTFDLEPGAAVGPGGGIQANIGDPRGLDAFALSMGLNGADQLSFSPTGRLTVIDMTSDWPHPSFSGEFLPKTREVNDTGFTARWEVPHLAREIAQVSRNPNFDASAFGVRFYSPVDIYQQVTRAAKYGILFIALTFLTVFLSERLSARRVHPAQFLLIGIAQCVFFLLLLSFAEQFGFGWSYLGASAATIGLISFYGRSGLGLGKRWTVLGASLIALYGVLYLILQSTDYALLAGSILSFVAIALVMVLTRNEPWSGTQSSGPAVQAA
ncbi:MAG: cell envelope integrity protein CreD, partial [Paracoccaceae bacterium]